MSGDGGCLKQMLDKGSRSGDIEQRRVMSQAKRRGSGAYAYKVPSSGQWHMRGTSASPSHIGNLQTPITSKCLHNTRKRCILFVPYIQFNSVQTGEEQQLMNGIVGLVIAPSLLIHLVFPQPDIRVPKQSQRDNFIACFMFLSSR